ncbi:hypothetical protein PRCB_02260 [Pantoea rodasii]|uniref:Uncharacterized protein n=2 Tax=Pantoea rodasii TaxID=1076549 RepID=A0A2M9WIW2_9GAMM|nr:hypothetical protein [Pantoea rodasii]PJZ07502.1 hypothetical protein PRCB_02260 [Pantoea rodasii]
MLLKELKKFANEISLSCIASFLIGAYTVFLINFFYFDNHITPPGVSAFVASMALLFTVYAAAKVKDWYVHKLNDKAFEKTDAVLVKHAELFHDLVITFGHVESMLYDKVEPFLHNSSNKEMILDEFKNGLEGSESLIKTVRDITVLIGFLRHWNVSQTGYFNIRTNVIFNASHNFDKNIQLFRKRLEDSFDGKVTYSKQELLYILCSIEREYTRIMICVSQIRKSSHAELFIIDSH